MNCPKCGATTEEIVVKSVKVDRCPECGGTWYDRDELEALKDLESRGDLRWLDTGLWQDADQVTVGERSDLACPRDGARLVVVRYGEPEITIDVCPVCFGLWLDRGEYEKIIEHLERAVDSETVAEYLADVGGEVAELFAGRHGLKTEAADLAKIFHLLRLRLAAEHPALVKVKEAIRAMFPG